MMSLRSVQSALSEATERFAAELAAPASVAPQWTEFEWTMAKAVAVLHGVTPLMESTLRWRGPPDWQQFVSEQFRHTASRHQRLMALLRLIDEISRETGVPFIALKGSALHAQGVYTSGQRPMADIDLLLPERALEAMSDLLKSLGYIQTFATWKHRIFEPQGPTAIAAKRSIDTFGENERAAIKIELHTHLSERLPIAAPDISEFVFARALQPGLNRYPSQIALLLHLLLHAAGNIVGRNLRLIHLHDIALLCYRLGLDDWSQLLSLRVSRRPLWWALPPLRLAHRYYRGCVPADVLTELSNDCPRALKKAAHRQSLSDVSYTALSDEAFPGLAWTASFAEKLKCIQARLNPGVDQRAMIEVLRAEPWAVSAGWSQLSRARRVMRRILTRPPRLPTMYIVRAALAASQHSIKLQSALKP
jgi:hypothetical protein